MGPWETNQHKGKLMPGSSTSNPQPLSRSPQKRGVSIAYKSAKGDGFVETERKDYSGGGM